MKRLFQLLIFLSLMMFFSGQAIVSGQESDQTKADREVAEELAIERRLAADLEALKAQEEKLHAIEELLDRKKKSKAQKSDLKKKADKSDLNLEGSITINGKKIEIDEEHVEKWLKEHGGDLEAWAEKHAHQWEDWAGKFESKMERWAESQEGEWEGWAEKYSKTWEKWAEKIESGEIETDEISGLVEKNLEMLSDMPLGNLIDGALKEGLGELENAPWESLGELHEIVGGSLEHALRSMEQEIANSAAGELKQNLGKLKTKELKNAILMLQDSIESKQKKSHDDADDIVIRVQQALKNNNLDALTEAKIIAAVEQSLTKAQAKNDAAEQGKRWAKTHEMTRSNSIEAEQKAIAEMKQQLTLHTKELASKLKQQQEEAQSAANQAAAMAAEKKTLETYYAKLKNQKEKLDSKESEIDQMRREIRELRKEVERMKKDKD